MKPTGEPYCLVPLCLLWWTAPGERPQIRRIVKIATTTTMESRLKKMRFRWASSFVSSRWKANSNKNNKWGMGHRMPREWAPSTQIRIFLQPANIYVFLRIGLPSLRNQRIWSPKPLSSVFGSKGFSNSCKQLQPVTDFQMRFQLARIRVGRTLL